MKSLILIGLAFSSACALANSGAAAVEGGVGRLQSQQEEDFAPIAGTTFSTNDDISAGYLEFGGSMPLYSFVDLYGMLGVTSQQKINTSSLLLEDSDNKYTTRYDTEIQGKQIYLSTGFDIHTPQQTMGLSVGARIGLSAFQQHLSFQQILSSSTDPALKDQLNKLQNLKENQVQVVPVYGVYLQYQFNRHDSVRFSVTSVTTDFDTDDVMLTSPVNATIEQEVRMVGLLFSHRY